MTGDERREAILNQLNESTKPLSGGFLAKQFSVSRQVIVQDIALLRATGHPILSAARGYVLERTNVRRKRVFKVHHTPDEAADEMNLIVDCGGQIEDVFIYHRIYGVVRAPMHIASRLDVRRYEDEIAGGKSQPLSNATSGYHYHTVTAESEQVLDIIQQELKKRGYLAELKDYEPVNFWKD